MNYSDANGRSLESLESELRAVYSAYPEYCDPAYGGGDFDRMVQLFAHDDFYKTHYVARTYLLLKGGPRHDT